jgi:hypothetical protein
LRLSGALFDRCIDNAVESRFGDDGAASAVEDEIDPEALGRLDDGEILRIEGVKRKNGSSGRTRTCNLVVTSAPKFLLGLDYLFTRPVIRAEGAGRFPQN